MLEYATIFYINELKFDSFNLIFARVVIIYSTKTITLKLFCKVNNILCNNYNNVYID